jgi:hypothetical protein
MLTEGFHRVLRMIFGSKRNLVIEWGKLHNKELYALCSSTNIIRVVRSRRLRCAGHIAHMEERRDAHRILVGKTEGRRQLEKPKHRWEDSIKMDLQEVRCGGMEWIDLAQDRNRCGLL